jgi:hypothetical protein
MKILAAALLTTVSLAVIAPTLEAQPSRQPRLLLRFDNVTISDLMKTGGVTRDDDGRGNFLSLVCDTAWAMLTKEQRDTLDKRGLHGLTVATDTDTLALIRRALYGPSLHLEPPYHTLKSLNTEIDVLQAKHPELVHAFTIGTTTAGKLPIRAVKICRNVAADDDRPTILFDGCHHSNEILGAEICMRILRTFTESTDPEIIRWLTEFQIYVVPVVNMDGYDVVTSGLDPRWRKNRRDTNGDGILDIRDGVDINRNYDFNWAHGGSGDPVSERYRGQFPFSESENRAFASLARDKHFLASLTYHSEGQVIYYPWTWGTRKAPDDSLLTSIARHVAGSIRTLRGDTTYKAEYGAGLVGQSYPWLYGTLGTFDFVVETGEGASFPPAHYVERIVNANLQGAFALLRSAEGPGIKMRVVDKKSGNLLNAEIWFPAIETEDVHRRTTRPGTGILYRLLLPGTYQVIVSSPGYAPQVINGILIKKTGWTSMEVSLSEGEGENH